MDIDRALNTLTSQQSGIFTSTQAFAIGMTSEDIRARLARGSHIHLAPRVYALAGMPITQRVRLHAALAEASGRSAVSHDTAAAHWGFPGFALEPFHLVRVRDGTFEPATLGTVHTTRRLPHTQVVDADGLHITTPSRTLFDLASRESVQRLERLTDHCLSQELTTPGLLRRTLAELSGRGQTGIRAMRALIEDRRGDYRPGESGLEVRFRQIMRDEGIKGFSPQVVIQDERGTIGRVDFLHDTLALIVEVDGDLHHTSITDRRNDQIRQARLEALGYTVLRITGHEVWHDPEAVVARVRAAVRESRPRRV